MNYKKILEIVRQTRELTLPHWGNVAFETKGSVKDVVTEFDKEVETFLKDRLNKLHPDIAFFGEEYGGDKGEKFWTCDPIDGTAHFIRGLPFCTTMLSLIEKDEVQFSAIYDFVGNKMYHATKGGGAFCDDEKISVSDRSLDEAYLSYETHIHKQENLDLFLKMKKRSSLVKFICAGYEFAMVASGKLDGRISFDPYGKLWDYAPGSLLVAEAGGVVVNIGKDNYDYKNFNFIASNKKVYNELTTGDDTIFPII